MAEIETDPYGKKETRKDDKLIRYVEGRMQQLENLRYPWWNHWRELAQFILPRRYRWFITPNDYRRGAMINQAIIDDTGTLAARKCAAGMKAGITSPSRPWFRLTLTDSDLGELQSVKAWLDEVSARMMRVMSASNYYLAKGVQYFDLVVFGTAPMIIYEDYETVIRCYNPVCGEYYCAEGARYDVNVLYRKITMTTVQLVDEFGFDACSSTVQSLYKQGDGTGKDQEVIVGHAIEPNPEYIEDERHIGPGGLPRNHKFREVYWEWGNAKDGKMLRLRGYEDQPFSCPRWDVMSNDAYGRSPGMDALGNIKQLQFEQKRKGQAIDKQVNPPMRADPAMKNEPASLLPGAINYVSTNGSRPGFESVYDINLNLRDMKEDIADVRQRIQDAFFNDVFFMISSLDTVRSATEIDARREEQLLQLGPVIERNESEGLTPDIYRIFKIMMRRGLLPKPPPEVVQAGTVKVTYTSMLAEAQRAAATTGIERLYAFAGSIAAGMGPDVLDNLDNDETIRIYGNVLRVPTLVMRDKRQVQQRREQRAAAAAQQKAMADAGAAVAGAETLSKTEVGGGQNALELMLNGLPASGI